MRFAEIYKISTYRNKIGRPQKMERFSFLIPLMVRLVLISRKNNELTLHYLTSDDTWTLYSMKQMLLSITLILVSDITYCPPCQAVILNNGAAVRKCRTPSPYMVSGQDREGVSQRGRPVVQPAHNTTCSDTEHEELEVSMLTSETSNCT